MTASKTSSGHLQEARTGALARIWKHQISPFPENLLPFTTTQEALLKRLSNGKTAFVSDNEELRSLLNYECHLHIGDDRAYGSSLAFAVTKGAQFKDAFDWQ